MKNITEQSKNRVTIIGKLLDVTFNTGKTRDKGTPWESARMNIRVTHKYGGRTETSDIPVTMFATQYTLKGGINPAYTSLQSLKEFKTAQNVGFDLAETVICSGRSTTLRENNFVTKTGQFITGWQINASFIAKNNNSLAETGIFDLDVFIIDKHPELDHNEEPTGRLVLKCGIIQYGGKLDVIEFIAEGPEQVDYIERAWNEQDTVNIQGRIRVTSVEEEPLHNSGWGEEIPESSTRLIRELIITTGSDEPKEEEFAYDPVEIKKAFNVRKSMIEQMQIDAKNNNTKTATAGKKQMLDWE